METHSKARRALKRAIEKAGSQAEMARLCGNSQPAVWQWLKRGNVLPAEYVLRVEAATGVSRHDLRPDIYPVEESRTAVGA
ncbi:transcriptional regulator [Parasphingorhabdus sp.]|uniref:transcriptional regulator n=1 Tax=Parasphingorhabdus sp. TaxID=2709688 RepID=UPI00359347C9